MLTLRVNANFRTVEVGTLKQLMLCRNCGKSIVDAARFCSFCGLQQPVEPSSQPASGDTSAHSPMPDSAVEASDVTVILPRRRANALVAPAAHRNEGTSSASTASKDVTDKSATHRFSVPAMKVGGAAAIVIIAVFVAAEFYASRFGTPAGKVGAPPASATEPVSAPVPRPMHGDEPDGASANPEAPSIPAIEAATAVKEAPIAEAPTPEATPQVPMDRTVAPPKDAAQRKKGRVPTTPVPESAPVESPPPQPVAIAPPTPAPVTASPSVEPTKVERVACADSSNPFSRELCLWQECAKPEYHSHAECARFTGSGGQP